MDTQEKGGTSNCAQSCWKGWLSLAAKFNKGVRKFYYRYGHFIAGHPMLIIILCIVITGAFGWGLVRIKLESRTEKLYVPQNSRAEVDLKKGDKFFTVQTRIVKVVMVRSDKGNVLTPSTLIVGNEVMESIVNHTNVEQVCIKVSGPRWPYIRNVTAGCLRLDPFQIFNYSVDTMTKGSIPQTVTNLMRNADYLMLNGRPLSRNIDDIFGKISYDGTGNITHAKALRIEFPIFFPNTDDEYSKILEWEGNFLKHMKSITDQIKKKGLDIHFFTLRSIDDSISDSTGGDIKYISITFAIMCTFTCLALSRFRDRVSGHGLIGTLGLVIVGMGIACGFGLVAICGTKFTAQVGILPFLILGVAIDDMFIILDELDRRNFNLETREIVAEVLAEVGGSVTMTTLTDLVAFAVSTSSAFPAVQYFCTYAAVGLTFSFLMIMTIFVAFLVYDINRIKAGRFDMVPFLKMKKFEIDPQTGLIVKPSYSISTKIMKKLGQFITTVYGSLLVIVISIGLVTAGIYGALNISEKFTLQMLGKDGSSYIKFLDTESIYYTDTAVINIIVPGSFALDSAANQQDYLKLTELTIQDNDLMFNKSINWLRELKTWSQVNGTNITGGEFLKSLRQFLTIPRYRQYRSDIKFIKNMTEIAASRVVVFMRNTPDSSKGKDGMLKVWDTIDKKSPINPYIASVPFLYFEQYVLIVPETTRNVIICAITVLIMTAPFLLHPGILILMVFGFAALIVELLGLMTIWNVSLNSISMIVLTMAIGFCVDYSAHVAHAYITSDAKDSKTGTIFALSTMGASVVMGGFSTFLGMLVTGFSSSEIFRIFFKMFFGIVTLGLLHGLIILPTFLSIFRIARVPAETPNENIDANGHIVMNRVANECHGAEVRG